MPRHAEQSAPAQQESGKALRKNIDAKTKRLGIRQTRGEDADPNMERVSITDDSGKERFVTMSRDELKRAEERADKDFDRAIAAVTAGEELDKKMVADLLGSNKEEILALARKEGDVKGAMFKVMEDAVDSLKEYDRLVDKAVADSGYTGIVADGLRDSLLKERTNVFGEALRQSAGPRAKRNLEHAVRAKVLAEASRQVAALAETVGEPSESEEPAVDDISDIQADIALLRNVESSYQKNRDDAKLQARVNALDRSVEQSVAHWAALYLTEHPRASVAEVLRLAEESGLDEFITKKDVERLKKGDSVGELHAKLTPQDLDAVRAARASVEYVGGYRVAKPDSMEIIDDDREEEDLEPAREIPFPKRSDARRPDMIPTRMEDFDVPKYVGEKGPEEIPDVTDLLVDDEPPKKGFLQGLTKTGRKLMLGMALLFGMKAGAPDQRLPHQEDQGPSRETAAMMANMDIMAEPVGETTGISGETQAEEDQSDAEAATKAEGDVEYKKGDPRNLKRALKILKDSGLKGRAELALERHQNLQGALQAIDESGLPGKAEFQKMKAKEKREELEAAMGRIEAMRLIGDMKSPVLDAVKRADLKKKLDQHQSFLDAMQNLDEIK